MKANEAGRRFGFPFGKAKGTEKIRLRKSGEADFLCGTRLQRVRLPAYPLIHTLYE